MLPGGSIPVPGKRYSALFPRPGGGPATLQVGLKPPVDLRILDIEEIKSLPHVPMSHPFVERLIGSVRRELLDQTFFLTATDLENKLRAYQGYNEHRCHSSRDGVTPDDYEGGNIIDIRSYGWKKHCRGLFVLPEAA